ncbi:nuclear transport factor 2 family protein [Pimelobacter simplex]|uniref:nuclear transport factor 2 family protein n=1 Tax=Nocardioides simplex TaxID=2045 RepID=UPI003827A0C8
MRALRLVAGFALVFALVGCSSDDGKKADELKTPSAGSASSNTPGETGSEGSASDPKAALEAAYRTYIDAFLSGDGTTPYNLLSKRCQAATPLSEFAESVEAAAELYGPLDYTITSVTVSGNEGRVRAEFPVKALQGGDPRGSRWVLEGGEWRSDKCD